LFGVGEGNAKGDAEKIEHGLSEETLRMLAAFVQFALSNPKVLDEYRRFLRKKKNST
jgi:Mn-dependent DtxR family transcriptional regulator